MHENDRHEELTTQLSQERYALGSLLDFVRILTPDIGPTGIIRSVLRTIMGKSLIKDAFAYIEMPRRDEEAATSYKLVSRSGFRDELLPEILTEGEFLQLLEVRPKQFALLPLLSPDGVGYLGVLSFGKSINPNLRVETEETYLASLSALTSIALTNARLFERERERQQLESELKLAREIQESLFPQRFPQVDRLEFAAVSRPSQWVGGDYYDVIRLDEYRVLIAVADVVGKGVTAALTMSNLQAALRALVSLVREGQLDLLHVIKELNRLMCESTAPERFITGIFGVLDARSGRFECGVCGHPNPILVSPDSSTVEAESTGIPLGIVATFPYETRLYHLNEGSAIVLYTDGLSEAKYEGNMIGPKGIAKVIQAVGLLSVDLQGALERIVESPMLLVEDDITILAVRYAKAMEKG
jgi:serine phosphatase RsbU (regulator of sigma subunit)